MVLDGGKRDSGGPGGREEDRRVLIAVVLCTAVLIGWYLVARVGVLDDVIPEYSSQWRDF